MPQELDEVEDPEELAEGDLDELADDDLIEDDDVLAADDEDVVGDLPVDDELDEPAPIIPTKAASVEDVEEDEEEEPDDEDVEASLDMILKERLVVEEPEEDDEVPEPEDRSDGGVERVLPKQPDEFVCRSCFLVKHPNQLADQKRMLCRDCV